MRKAISISTTLHFSSTFVFVFVTLLLLIFAMADDASPTCPPVSASSGAAAVHIVYTEQPKDNEEPEAYHVRTLASVLGGEQAARDALIYSYKSAASGFSAKLTPEQVTEISKQPGVLQVVPSRTLQLHSGKAGMRC